MIKSKTTGVRTSVIALFVMLSVAVCANSNNTLAFDGGVATSQQWSFSEWNYGPVSPDAGWDNDFGTPLLFVSSNSQWSNIVDQHQGVWTLAGEMDFLIPNYPVLRPEKEMWIELTWKAAGLSYLPDRPLIGVEADYDSLFIERYQETSLGDGWTTTLFKVNIWPNPVEEWIAIKGDILIDRVAIDTTCIPEPATFGLLFGGALMALRRRRKS